MLRLIFVGLLAAAFMGVQAEVVLRNVHTTDSFVFLGKFCFDFTPPGTVSGTLDLVLETKEEGLQLAFFDDEENSWPAVYGSSLSCSDKLSLAKNPPGPVQAVSNGWKYHLSVLESLRPRFWYAVLAKCDKEGAEPLRFSYQLTFLNEGVSHFSSEDEGLLSMYALFLIVWCLGAAAQGYALNLIRQSGERVHPVVALLSLAIGFEVASLALFSLHWLVYSGNGIGLVDALTFGQFCSVTSLLLLTGLLMLLAKGWTISTEVLDNRAEVALPMILLAIGYLILEAWGSIMRDQATTLFIFDTAAGWLIVLLHIGLFLWFTWRTHQTYEAESDPEKRQFYERFRLVFGAWFLALPVIVISAAMFLEPYQRLYHVAFLTVAAKTFGCFALAFLMWPTRAHAYFKISLNPVRAYESL
eukprot:CAMPEP_0196770528 /NCGR_PEP_ID=MMETSP1104-20130614/1189_1 /TAXON_ID=33652 /ORGANISM="Cafeteria sp., Strain Caron Lab Isolate" /LENGTH=413 /DNA_ID=CAMNT_0042140641 /DNA_START=67 /DNA_END=1308 /DNA_ORIENTATION=+